MHKELLNVLPTCACFYECANFSAAHLYPAEEAHILGASIRRRSAFSAGRTCARRALSEIGIKDFPILAGPCGEPLWPAGIVGSISHTNEYCLAAVAHSTAIRSIGIDVELAGCVETEVWHSVFTLDEIRHLRRQTPADRPLAATIRFSAKEAFFKFYYSLTKCALGLMDMEVDYCSGRFNIEVSPRKLSIGQQCTGRYALLASLNTVVTSVSLSNTSSS